MHTHTHTHTHTHIKYIHTSISRTHPHTQQVLFVKRPEGKATPDCWKVVETAIPTATEPGQLVVKINFVSLDPYMRGRMNDTKSYAPPQALDAVMDGGAVGEVIESKSSTIPVGAHVSGMLGWQQYALTNDKAVQQVNPALPLSVYLGAVGMPGVTAYYGINGIIAPKSGETVVISAASGAVGSVAGQLAKSAGCRVVGIAGGKVKCDYVMSLGFDACIDYKTHTGPNAEHTLVAALEEACPKGIDGYFENVGGMISDAVMRVMNAHARVAYCGSVSGYDTGIQPMKYAALIVVKRLLLQGFIIAEHLDQFAKALPELGGLVASGKLKYKETVLEGLEAAPAGLIGLLYGEGIGKIVVRVA